MQTRENLRCKSHALSPVAKIAALALVLASGFALAGPAQAGVMISSATTQNMTCSAGVCTPTANKAVLNAGELEALLASGNVTVSTKGAGVQAEDIIVASPITWSSTATLALDAGRSTAVNQAVSVTGLAGLSLMTGGTGTLSFGSKGSVAFQNLSSVLVINGTTYTLENSIASLASAIASNPSGTYALAAPYDASQDGKYSTTPVPTTFTGTFEGLGNAISNLTISIKRGSSVGLFAEIGSGGYLRDLEMRNVNIYSQYFVALGALVGTNYGTVSGTSSSGMMTGANDAEKNQNAALGGLVGTNFNSIESSWSSAKLKSKGALGIGGLVGVNVGTVANSQGRGSVSGQLYSGGLVGENVSLITQSSATGNVSGEIAGGLAGINEADNGVMISQSYATGKVSGDLVGGLVGANGELVTQSYSTGPVLGSTNSNAGGFVGYNSADVTQSYSTGSVTAGDGSYIGGFVGDDLTQGKGITYGYWDTDTSGITDPSQGAGNLANDPGITGLTTAQFQSGLPHGYDPNIWAENSNTNDGFPYLISNSPK